MQKTPMQAYGTSSQHRQMDMRACPLGSSLAEIKFECIFKIMSCLTNNHEVRITTKGHKFSCKHEIYDLLSFVSNRKIRHGNQRYKFPQFTDNTFTDNVKDKCQNAKWRKFVYESNGNCKKNR